MLFKLSKNLESQNEQLKLSDPFLDLINNQNIDFFLFSSKKIQNYNEICKISIKQNNKNLLKFFHCSLKQKRKIIISDVINVELFKNLSKSKDRYHRQENTIFLNLNATYYFKNNNYKDINIFNDLIEFFE
jgi:hypothetical protein